MDIKTQEINYTDSNGLKQGLWRHWDIDGELWVECTFVDGNLQGLYRRWHYGKLSCEGYFINGLKNGLLGYWNNHSELIHKGHYVNGIQEGEEIHYEYEY